MCDMKLAVTGIGFWGKNILRNFFQLDNGLVKYAIDLDGRRLDFVNQHYPGVKTTPDFQQVLADPEIDAVAIVTPAESHFDLALAALKAKKHVFLEKPAAMTSHEVTVLAETARLMGLQIMVDHTFMYNPAVTAIKDLLGQNTLGRVYYIRMTRVNLGLFQKHINVVWDLTPHDLSILLYLLPDKPHSLIASGSSHITEGIEDVATLSLYYPNNLIAFITCSWIDPIKVRDCVIVGAERMLYFDDTREAGEKITIFDKRVEGPKEYDSFQDFKYSYIYGDNHYVPVAEKEPLKNVAQAFLTAVSKNEQPLSNSRVARDIICILEAADRSIKRQGQRVVITYDDSHNPTHN